MNRRERPSCAEIDELLPAFALDALDPQDRGLVEAHLDGCGRHSEAPGFGAAAARLADLAPEMDPPAGLRDRILAIPGASSVSPRRPAPVQLDSRRGRPRWTPYALAAGFAALALFMGAWNVMLLTGDGEGETVLVASSSAGDISSRVVYVPSENIAIVEMAGLSELPSDRAYQLWAIAPGQAPASVGLVQPVAGGVTASVPGEFEAGWTFAVTIEPAGGSVQPTTDPIVVTTL